MKTNSSQKFFSIGLITIIGIIADQASKTLVFAYLTPPSPHLPPGEYSLPIIPHFLDFTCSLNTGIAFGMGQNMNIYFTILSTAVIFAMGYFYQHFAVDTLSTWGYALVLSGAIGNLLDRIFYQAVRDFIDAHWYTHHWPIFNIADSCISVGVVLLLISSFRHEKG